MDFYLVLRATEDWENLNLEEHIAREDRPFEWRGPECRNIFASNLRRWHELPINYFQWRAGIKEIAMRYWTLPWIPLVEALTITDPNVIFIPIDDDDIIYPKIAEILAYYYENKSIASINWGCWYYNIMCKTPLIRDVDTENAGQMISSNCYSIRANMASWITMWDHTEYTKRGRYTKLQLPCWKSIHLIHPADTLTIYNKNALAVAQPILPTNAPHWAEKYVKEIHELAISTFGDKTP